MGQGSGEAVPVSPRTRGLPTGSPRPGRGTPAGSPRSGRGTRSPLASPTVREAVPVSPLAETMGKAKELFVLCDKEGKGFITKRDMQVSSRCGRITKVRLIIESLTFHLLLFRGYKRSCRCPLNSWRRCLRVWTDRATDSSLLLSSTQDLVSVVCGVILDHIHYDGRATVLCTNPLCLSLSVVQVSLWGWKTRLS